MRRILPQSDSAGPTLRREGGFTLIEVIIAASLMLVLVVGVLSAFSYATNINRANNIRSQALTILQDQAEYYRGLSFRRGGTDQNLNAGTYVVGEKTSGDGLKFNVKVIIENMPNSVNGTTPSDAAVTLKKITIEAEQIQTTGTWFGGKTELSILRVKAN